MVGKYMAVMAVIMAVLFNSGYAGDDFRLELDKEVYKGLSDKMKITLTAPSLNRNKRVQETAPVKVTAAGSSFGINTVLAETGKDTGIFTGSVYFSFSANNNEEKKILVKNDAKLRVQYENLTAEAIWIPYNASLEFSDDKYCGLGDLPEITLTDHDLNEKPNVVEKIQVLVKSSSYSKGIPVTLEETRADSGEFSGRVKLTTGPSDPKKEFLHIEYNDEITALYTDNTNLNSSGVLCSAAAIWTPQTAAIKLNRSSFSGLNSRCTVTITDKDMNEKQDYKDIIGAKVTSDADPDGIYLRLTETRADSGIFSAELSFSRYSSNTDRNILKVGSESKIAISYCDEWNDENKKYTYVKAEAEFEFVEAELSASESEGAELYDSITITVKDPDEDTGRQKNTVPVTVTSSSGGSIRLWLEETGESTGSFKGTAYFSTRPVRDKEKKDVTLIVSQGDDIEVTYDDTTTPEGRKTVSRIYTWSYHKAEIELDKESYTGYNSIATVTIKDVEANEDPDKIDRIRIRVSSGLVPELFLTVEETKADSGIFKEKILFCKEGKGSRSASALEVAAGDTVRIAYEDQGDHNFGTVEASAQWNPHDAEVAFNHDIYYGNAAKAVITVEDWDMADNDGEKDRVTISVGIAGKTDAVKFPLEETGKNTGIFTGTIIINGKNGKGLDLQLKNGEELEVTYQDRDNTDNVTVERRASAKWFLKK